MHLPPQDIQSIAASTCIPWRALDGAHLFVSGATGFWGTWLLESFVRAREFHHLDAHLTFLSRDPEAFFQARPHLQNCKYLHACTGDVRDFCFPEIEFSHVIHAATPASASFNDSAPLEMFSTIVDGTRRTLELCHKRRVRRLLLASSGAIYGAQPPHMTHIAEDFAGAPAVSDVKSAYAQGKRAAEWLALAHAQSAQANLEVTIARGFAFVGPMLPLDIHFAIGNFVRDALAGDTISLSGDGTPHRSYLYASEMTIWLWAILLRGTSGRAYNVGSEESLSLREVAQVVADVARAMDGKPRQVLVAREADLSLAPSRYVPSTQRAREELGLVQAIPLEEAVRRTLVWAQQKI